MVSLYGESVPITCIMLEITFSNKMLQNDPFKCHVRCIISRKLSILDNTDNTSSNPCPTCLIFTDMYCVVVTK